MKIPKYIIEVSHVPDNYDWADSGDETVYPIMVYRKADLIPIINEQNKRDAVKIYQISAKLVTRGKRKCKFQKRT